MVQALKSDKNSWFYEQKRVGARTSFFLLPPMLDTTVGYIFRYSEKNFKT